MSKQWKSLTTGGSGTLMCKAAIVRNDGLSDATLGEGGHFDLPTQAMTPLLFDPDGGDHELVYNAGSSTLQIVYLEA